MVETMFKAEMLLAGLVTGLNLGERAIILVANKTDLVRFKTSMSNLSSPRARAVTGRRCPNSAQCSRCQLGCSGIQNFPCISGNCYRSILSEIRV